MFYINKWLKYELTQTCRFSVIGLDDDTEFLFQAAWSLLFATLSQCIHYSTDGLASQQPRKPIWRKTVRRPTNTIYFGVHYVFNTTSLPGPPRWHFIHLKGTEIVLSSMLHWFILTLFCVWGDDDDSDDVAVLLAVPAVGPVVQVNGKAGRNHVELFWNEIDPSDRRGFITNYTIYYRDGSDVYSKSLSERFHYLQQRWSDRPCVDFQC